MLHEQRVDIHEPDPASESNIICAVRELRAIGQTPKEVRPLERLPQFG